ncbi:MAG: glutamate racemase [Ruminococcus sp.]|jgi:glutamate racemase|nr:glutamate racemase [Ruminococcus sp.]
MGNNRHSIGVFDSGLGGLTTVKEINKLLPKEDIIYLGDTARIPYGGRSKETILKYAKEDTAFLRKYDVKMIIAACGTVSSVLGDDVLSDDIPFLGVLAPAAAAAYAATQSGKIGVIGTSATIKSGAYGKAIKAIGEGNPHPKIFGKACPMLVHLVENGYTELENEAVRYFVEQYLKPIKDENVDTLILGCTHYPLLKDAIGTYMGEGVTLISPGEEAAKIAARELFKNELLSENEKGENRFFVTDSVENFEENAEIFLGESVHGKCERVSVSG